MKIIKPFLLLLSVIILLASCGIYSFTGASIPPGAKTVSVQYFPNKATTIQPNLSQVFTEKLKDAFVEQTNLTLTEDEGDDEDEEEVEESTETSDEPVSEGEDDEDEEPVEEEYEIDEAELKEDEDGEDEEEVEESNTSAIEAELKEYKEAVHFLKDKLHEVNILNAKLLFTNKLFKSYSLDNNQKLKVVETFDRAQTTREIKLVYSTLAEQFSDNGSIVTKKSIKESASTAVASTRPSKESRKVISEEVQVADRFRKLAGLIK